MRVKIPSFATQPERFAYLRKNVGQIIQQKKSLPIKSDIFDWGCLPVNTKATIKEDGSMLGPDEIEVNAIANLSGWCDSYMDVMIKDNWNKTISDKAIVYHLKNHEYSTDDVVGKNPELYTKIMPMEYFGITSDVVKAQALLMRSVVPKEYDSKTYLLYRDNQIKQHSIGLRYIQIVLCMNSDLEEDVTYKKNWDKYYPCVINKDLVDQYRYFFAVIESQILENSCVLFGANINTGVYSTSGKKKKKDGADDESPDYDDPDENDPDNETAADEAPKESNKSFMYI
ncbi:MAG TPA: hypothetical protein VNX40_05405 [Mucilaginibacter sp.]|jgi:hypothetical protein|nr:hypothetical protein [Mucilaginibacter sp.]